MAGDTTHVKGLGEIQKLFDKVPVAMERNFLRGGLRHGMNSQVKPAVAGNIRSVSGQLAKGLRVGTSMRRGVVTARLRATGPHAHVARWIEYGVKPHVILPKNRRALAFGGRLVRSIQHPGFKGTGFMRSGLDRQAGPAVVATADYIKRRFTKAGIDASYIMIEGDE